jgi:lipopolysaccharide/colanic/teichoic acid biosynthesis glycosyltransferase
MTVGPTEQPRSRRRTTTAIHSLYPLEQRQHPDETLPGVFWLDLRTRDPKRARAKRLFDVAGALAQVVVLAPLFLLIALLIKATSRGPVMFRQRRIGYRCNEFDMYKFRTMYVGSEAQEASLAAESGKAFLKLQNDPRVTPLGRLLRRTSLDELPQLFNVLEGTMSLVGPRPLLMTDMSKFPRRGQLRRFSVPPGITGLWQVSGRSACTDEERMRLDREYVDRWSLLFDLKILLRTLLVVFSRNGAA